MRLDAQPTAAARALWPLSLVYAGAVALRNARYDRLGGAVQRAALPVISVGNITTGGTGKTPLVIEIAQRLERPAIVTRGYRGTPEHEADEVLELRAALPDVPVIVDSDRVRGARTAHDEHNAACVILDDGFQHRRLARDCDIVLIDALDPWGGGQLLPAGRLREPLTSLRRADVLVITRSNQVSPDVLRSIERVLGRYAPGVSIFHAVVEAAGLIDWQGTAVRAGALAGMRVLPVCGVGNPRSFLETLTQIGAVLAPPLLLRDHYGYQPGDVARIVAAARAAAAAGVATTRKDWVKLNPLWQSADRARERPALYRLDMRLRVIDPDAAFDRLLRSATACQRDKVTT